MTEEQYLTDLIRSPEGRHLAFMSDVVPKRVAQTVCSFLNTEGGTLLIGLDNFGLLKGVPRAQEQKARLSEYLLNSVSPEAPIMVSVEPYHNQKLLMVKVYKGSKPPYIFDGAIYSRRGRKSVKATAEVLSELISFRQEAEMHWERRPALGATLDDLDESAISQTLKDVKSSGRGREYDYEERASFLEHYGLYQEGNLTNAAVLLFAKNPARFLPQSRIRLTIFDEDKTSDRYRYDQVLEGNLFANREKILSFFDLNIATGTSFHDQDWLRQDRPYPKAALREGLMNAIVHRDYSRASSSSIVAFYPDKLEISNTGELPKGMVLSDLEQNHLSQPFNPDIAHIFYMRGMIEKIGRGTLKMIEDCKEKGYPKPVWITGSDITTLIFQDITTVGAERTDTLNTSNDTVSDTVKDVDDRVNDTLNNNDDTLNDTVNNESGKALMDNLVEKIMILLNEVGAPNTSDEMMSRWLEIVLFVTGKPGCKTKELMKHTGVSIATIRRDLSALDGVITHKGSSKTGGYYIAEDFSKKLTQK